MAPEVDDLEELLFFDTFSHEANKDINLDLVQFQKPVYITDVRIIPLGARVQADFPGGVRLGATNPSKFGIQFFVNDLGKPGASAFEKLGVLEYNQNGCINLDTKSEKILTDGLVLRGWYSTITLAVYGSLTKNVAEQIESPPHAIDTSAATENVIPIEVTEDITAKEKSSTWRESTSQPLATVASEISNFERGGINTSFDEPSEPDEGFFPSTVTAQESRSTHKSSRSTERSNSRNRTSSEGNDYARQKREWSRSPEYRNSRRVRRDRSRSDVENDHKWPRTPPTLLQQIDSPNRPRSPDNSESENNVDFDTKYIKTKSRALAPSNSVENNDESVVDQLQPLEDDDVEQFEPILSDDEIGCDDDNNDIDNDELELEDVDFEEAIKVFDPFKMPLKKFNNNLIDIYQVDVEIVCNIFDKFRKQTKIENIQQFLASTFEEKENFVYVCEELITQLNHISNNLQQRNFVLDFVLKDIENLNLANQILIVSLCLECACGQNQIAYKIRHIKVGTRLAALLSISPVMLKHLFKDNTFDIYKALLELYEENFMSLSIKLLILSAIYACLDSKEGVNNFLHNKCGYQRLLNLLQENPSTRAKFLLKSIIKKLHLYEALGAVQDLVTKQFVLTNCYSIEYYNDLQDAMNEIIIALESDSLSYQDPIRFLPVSKKFEIVKDPVATRNWTNMMQSYFKIHSLGESLLLLLTNQNLLPSSVLMTMHELFDAMLKTHIGIDYLINDCFETTQIIVNVLLGVDQDDFNKSEGLTELKEEKDEDVNELIKLETKEIKEEVDSKVEVRSSPQLIKLGLELAFKVQSRYHIDAITYAKGDVDVLVENLHALYSQTCNYPGRKHTVDTINLNNYIVPFLNLIDIERSIQSQRQLDSPGLKYKSPVLSYSVDVVDCCIRHCENLDYLIENGAIILDLAKNHEVFEPSVSAVLQEMFVYLKPLEQINIFSYENISPLVESIKRSVEYITTFPGDLIMGLRILRWLTIGDSRQNSKSDMMELKYKYVAIQFYTADGVMTLLNIFEKLNGYFEQPGLHAPALMTIQGIHCCQILLPALQVLREVLTFVIHSRNTEHKDVTPIEYLMRTYYLMHYYPEASQAYEEAQMIKSEIIKILLAYTQPNEQDEESLHKSLWTQMIREVLKSILTGPSTFIPGLLVFAELLPLPFPLPTTIPLQDKQTQRLLTERKLWSAHLHPESSLIGELIQTISPTSFPQLSDILTRVCLQLADLAPNMTLLVSKTVIDQISSEYTNNCSGGIGTSHLARLLNFFVQLTSYGSVKISALSIFSDRLYDIINDLLTTVNPAECHIRCQLNTYRILENFFDSDISIMAPSLSGNLELNLACALPPKELIPGIVDSIVTNLLSAEIGGSVALAISRVLIILSEHDITFYYLRKTLLAQKIEYQKWLNNVIDAHVNGSYRGLLETIVLLFRVLCYVDPSPAESIIPNRTLKLSLKDLGEIVGYKLESDAINPLKRIKLFLESNADRNETLILDIKDLSDKFENYDVNISKESLEEPAEPYLPQAEGIVTQYLSRPIYTAYDRDETQLNSNYWLEPLRLETLSEAVLAEAERIPCDLTQLIQSNLPADTNLTSDCKRILHLSASPQSSRERAATAPCFRTRRVEVEPATGRPEKKLFITPVRGRGFGRAPPSRGDLFRSRPPNTSRPPSLHVDDFLALETCGAQPTGPTGYNKISNIRGGRGLRSRGIRMSNSGSIPYRKSNPFRTGSPSTWDPNMTPPPPQHFRTATSEPVVTPHFQSDSHYVQAHFGGPPMRSRGRGRIRTYIR